MGHGQLVSLEGGDGSGKSTVAKRLHAQLCGDGFDAILIAPKRPTFSSEFVGRHMKQLSEILWENGLSEPRDQLNNHHWVFLSSAWLSIVNQHVVLPALAQNQIVILDSWYHKLLARFRVKSRDVFNLAQTCYATLVEPDLIILLDIDPEVAADRKKQFGYSETGNFDGLSGVTRENFITYQGWVRKSLLELSSNNPWQRIDVGATSTDDVVDKAQKLIVQLCDDAATPA